jgi:hypothetical protein
LGGSPRQIKVEIGDDIQTFDLSEVARIEFSGGGNGGYHAEAPPPPRDERPTLRRAPVILQPDDPGPSSPPAQPVAAAPQGPIEIPAQTNFVVRMIDAVDSETSQEGATFTASLDQPIIVNGQTVIPRGADAVVKLVNAQQSGRLTGKTELTLSLWSVKVNGKMVEINTQTISRASDPRGQKTAVMGAGGAVLGAIIGGIAGGGKGAAIGAGAGGAAGVGAEAATKGQRVKIPSETRLTFVLDSPVTIQ